MPSFGNPTDTRKIDELHIQSSSTITKHLEDENRRLREQLHNLLLEVPGKAESSLSSSSAELGPNSFRRKDSISQQQPQQQSEKEKQLEETIKSLKETNKKQSHNLKKYKLKLKKSKESITKRDVVISRLKKQHEKHEKELKSKSKRSSATKAATKTTEKLEEQVQNLVLEKRLCENRNQILTCQIDASEEREKKLLQELDSIRRQQQQQQEEQQQERRRRSHSVAAGTRTTSMPLASTTTNFSSNPSFEVLQQQNDVLQLKEELEKKIERIVLLELELEFCNEKIQDLEAEQEEGDDQFHETHEQEINNGHDDNEESSYEESDEEEDLGANARQVFLTRFMDVSVGESHVQLPFRHQNNQ
mmetsp:Transcript_14556/g.20565  ORF Transcript_14556/g.20565 Transcript_14556/m.20565 type:complete len:361 (+) Transcript_14556:93-1175(+)